MTDQPPTELPAQPSLRRLRAFGVRPKRDLGQNFLDRDLPIGTLIGSSKCGVAEREERRRCAGRRPGPVLSIAYAVIGFQVGLRFTRATVLTVIRLVPVVVASSLALLLLCSASALLLTGLLGIDPLTAFLAMVPGSIESVAIVAIGSNADISFVMALQTVRMFAVVLVGPPLARLAFRIVR